jgi:SAM-dependent methyltransferase
MTGVLWQKPGLSVVRCVVCGFYGADLDRWTYPYAEGDYYSQQIDPSEINPERSHIRYRVENIRKFKSGGRAVDLGCGLGESAIALFQRGFEVVGVEESANAVATLQKNFPAVSWRCMPIKPFLETEGDFEIITMFHVLEHTPQPRELCVLLADSLKPGGLLVVEVPDVAGGQARLRGWNWQYWLPHHVNYFNVKTLRLLLEPLGLQLLHVERKYHFLFPQNIFWKDLIHATLALLGFHDIITTYWRKVG